MPDNPLADALSQLPSSNVTRVLILGCESTGKTTLCQDVTHHMRHTLNLNAEWVIEYMRPFAQAKFNRGEGILDWDDLVPIAIGQMQAENLAVQQISRQGGGFVFCDTSLFEIMVYSYLYFDACPTPIEQAATTNHYEKIVLTGLDVPWVKDDLRESPHGREATDACFLDALALHDLDFMRIEGSREQRVAKLISVL